MAERLRLVALGPNYVDIDVYSRTPMPEIPDGEFGFDKVSVGVGGSGPNVCQNVVAMGPNVGVEVDATFVGAVGQDPFGDYVKRTLSDRGVNPQLVRWRDPAVLTNLGYNITDSQGRNTQLVTPGANQRLDTTYAAVPFTHAVTGGEGRKPADVVYLSGGYKMEGLAQSFTPLARIARSAGALVVVDHGRVPKDVRPDVADEVRSLVGHADIYLPSMAEFLKTLGVKDVADGLRQMRERFPDLITIVKDGENGVHRLVDDELHTTPAPEITKPIENLTGPGDRLNAGFILAHVACGLPVAASIDYALADTAAWLQGEEPPQLVRPV